MNVTENCASQYQSHWPVISISYLGLAGAGQGHKRRPPQGHEIVSVGVSGLEWRQVEPSGTAEMTTNACANGPSSVTVTSMRASQPGGVIALSRSSAPPVSAMVGRPDGRLTTPMSRQNTPARSPVPSALAQASLAAKRLA